MLENMYFKIQHTINTSHPRVHFISPYSSSAPTEHTHPSFFSHPCLYELEVGKRSGEGL